MARRAKKRVVFISSFLPRKCGIATFTTDLIANASSAAKGEFEPLVVAMRSGDDLKYKDPVKFEIRQDVKSDYICAADYINFSHVDLVSVQHEFGLFGGDGGAYLNLLLKRLKAPIVTTLHTILDEPEESYYKSMMDLCEASYKVVTMNERGVTMLRDVYGVSGKKVDLIAHGIPDLPFVDSNYYKHKFKMEGRRTILTFGLLNENKGIEVMLKAMPRIIEAEPSVVYIVLGMTHPTVLKQDGESYRFRLQQLVKELGIEQHVIFHNRFVDDKELHNFLCAADVYVTPYLSRNQLTSGTLSFAVGTGKAVVSTPYWAAEELLANGRGKLVGLGDSKGTAEAIVGLLKNDRQFYSLRRRAYDYGRSRTWPKIGQAYWKLFGAKHLPVRIAKKQPLSVAETISNIEVPELSLEHLKKLTDDTGLYQHAKFTIPNREQGYCTDDNARAVIAMVECYAQHPKREVLGLFERYLSFIMYAQNKDGSIRNFMNFDRTWLKNEPANDAFGRVLWALGSVMARPPSPAYLSIVKDCFDRSVGLVARQYPRGMAYSILGMSDYLKQFPGASDIKRQLELAADGLVQQYEENREDDWQWFEDRLTYDNAVLSHALFAASQALDNEKYLDAAKSMCDFLLADSFNGEHFSFVGCNGWYVRGQARAPFDQQPIEAASMVMMLRAGYDATGDKQLLKLQRKAFDWFLGANDLGVAVYDFRTKGCNDALMRGGVNINQGAESILSFLQSLLAIIETYSIIHEVNATDPFDIVGEVARPAVPIENVPDKKKRRKPGSETLDLLEK
ncbi:MAG: glycosyltransferase family 4 protein [Sedimentisphaerales bacterium]|nr:glycosyltransferase family 4 protein [Sedimentisphaerales bacterium]